MSHLMRKWIIAAGLILAVIFVLPQPALSQQRGNMQNQTQAMDISDQELEKFVKVQAKMTTIQDSARQNMVTAIQNTGLDVQTFNKISKQLQSAKSMEDVDASKDQMQKVQKASQEVQKIQKSMRQKQQQVLNDQAMSPQRFQEIRQAAMKNRKLLQRMQLLKQKNNN